MSRYIDADALREEVLYHADTMNHVGNHEQAKAFNYCLCMIDVQPTADVVEVVRCKDCINWQTDLYTSYDGYHYCSMIDIVIDGNFYCKDGERKILPKH